MRGQVVLIALVFFGIFISVTAALVSLLTTNERAERIAIAKEQAIALAEAGIDEAAYRLNQNSSYTGETDTALPTGTFTVTVTNIDATNKRVVAIGHAPSSQNPIATKTLTTTMSRNSSVISFRYGIQAGDGGFSLSNSSQIIGNAFSTGPIIGSGNYIRGTVLSAGASGLIYGIHATSSVYAHTLGSVSTGTIVDGDAHYVNKVNTTVAGTLYPNSPDQAGAALPISDAQISGWESDAAGGGTISACDSNGNYVISSSITLGPKKIACNLVVKSSSGVLTVTGPLWITGNITTQTGPTIKMDASLGSQNVAIIADNPADMTGSGVITVGQSSVFAGSGAPGSFVFLISQNKSAEMGGVVAALSLNQGASALVAYASHGLATLSQSVNVKEVTAYKIALAQSASVTYDTGLPNTVFQSGTGGSWAFLPGTYAVRP